MLYVLQENNYDNDYKIYGVYEGPDGINVDSLYIKWNRNFNYETLGFCSYPKYNGPYDVESIEYKQWLKEYKKVEDDWNKVKNNKIKEFELKYQGKNTDEMFLSYLEKDFNFKKVEAQVFVI